MWKTEIWEEAKKDAPAILLGSLILFLSLLAGSAHADSMDIPAFSTKYVNSINISTQELFLPNTYQNKSGTFQDLCYYVEIKQNIGTGISLSPSAITTQKASSISNIKSYPITTVQNYTSTWEEIVQTCTDETNESTCTNETVKMSEPRTNITYSNTPAKFQTGKNIVCYTDSWQRNNWTIGVSSYRAEPSQTGCGVLSTPNAVYNLTGNIWGITATCFNITGDNITLNCGSFYINGTNTVASHYAINITAFNTTIANCQIANFSTGIILNAATRYANITNNTINITYATSCSSTSTGCHAIWLNGARNNNISGNYLYGAQYPLALGTTATNNTISYTNITATSLGAVGFAVNSNNTLSYLNISSGGNLGVVFGTAGAVNNTIQYSNIYAVGRAVQLSASRNTFYQNIINSSGTTAIYGGIRLLTSSKNNFTNNIINETSTASKSEHPIHMESSSNNNTFINNTIISASSDNTAAINITQNCGNNTFIQNNISASVWINDTNNTNNYNNSNTGNIYYFSNNASGAWNTLNISCVGTSPCYANAGKNRPFNATTAAGNISGAAQDWFPYSENAYILSDCANLTVPNTIYNLTNNIWGIANTCINITAANVTLNCNGYQLNGTNSSGSTNNTAINSTAFNTTIKNCNISNFSTGIYISTSAANNANITNNTIDSTYSDSCSSTAANCHDIYLFNASFASITYNTLTNTGGYTLILVQNSSNANVSYNHINTTGQYALRSHGGTGGAYPCLNSTFSYNSVNASSKACTLYFGMNATISNNNCTANTEGIYITETNTSLIYDNYVQADQGLACATTGGRGNSSKFYRNNVSALIWVNVSDTVSNDTCFFNTSNQGNIYYFANNGSGAWNTLDISCSGGAPCYADQGTSRPFNGTTVAGNFTGITNPYDWFPYVGSAGATTCTPPAINNNWLVNLADNCVLSGNPVNLGTGNVQVYGVGTLTFIDSALTCNGVQRKDGDTGASGTITYYTTIATTQCWGTC